MHRMSLFASVLAGLAGAVVLTSLQSPAAAHCEIPCGIYGDHARILQLLEDTATIAKSVSEIQALAGARDALGVNQLTRWINNKEEHATKIQDTIAQYFLNQRVKPAPKGSAGWEEYVERLTRHHAVMVAAMATKQTVDPAKVEELRVTINAIAGYYPPEAAQAPATAPPTRR